MHLHNNLIYEFLLYYIISFVTIIFNIYLIIFSIIMFRVVKILFLKVGFQILQDRQQFWFGVEGM